MRCRFSRAPPVPPRAAIDDGAARPLPVIRQSMLNLIGGVLPAVAAIACTPLILQSHGSAFFGVYSIQTALLVVIGLMDLGIARGITLATYDNDLNPGGDPVRPFKAGMRLSQVVAALVSSTGGVAAAAWFMWRPSTADIVASTGLYLLSGALTIMTLPYRSVMEIQGRFGILNAIRSLSACAVFVSPLLVPPASAWVFTATASVVLVTRVVTLLAYSRNSGIGGDRLRAALPTDRDWLTRFARRCGWVGLTNALSLALTYADRFVLGALSSATQVSHYVVASEAATKIWLVAGAVQSAVTPRVAAERIRAPQGAGEASGSAVRQAKLLVLLAVVVPSALLMVFCAPVFRLWLGSGFDPEISRAARILMAGIALNSMSQLNFMLLQLHGGEASGAVLQILNIALSAILMAVLIPAFGTAGAAAAFSIRLGVDAFVTRHLVRTKARSAVGFTHLELAVAGAVLLAVLTLTP